LAELLDWLSPYERFWRGLSDLAAFLDQKATQSGVSLSDDFNPEP
jgi:hypothetical protein